jgi:glycosyltransferase involved in cell wall biosynthesis
MLRVFSAKALNAWIENRVWERSEHNFDLWVAAKLHPGINWVHTYEHAALATLIQAEKLGIPSFCEQPSQHYQFMNRILNEQLALFPGLKCVITQLMMDGNAKRTDRRKDMELKLADHIICNSAFTLRTLLEAGIPNKKIIRLPLGFPDIDPVIPASKNKKFTFLFAGNQCLRKGCHILFKAWTECGFDADQTELILIGKNQLPESLRNGLPGSVKFIPNIPHNELMAFYHKADVFVFPTLADGFGMVISEAMSKGIPVITTMNSGGPDIITHQKNGFLIDAGDVKALANQMKWCYGHPEETRQAGIRAMETAAGYPWKTYRKHLVGAVLKKVNERKSVMKETCLTL